MAEPRVAAPAATGRRYRSGIGRDGVGQATLFFLPALLLYGVLTLFPTLETVRLSFTNAAGLGSTVSFVGLDNYRALANDTIFWKAFRQTLLWLVLHVVLAGGTGLLLAVLIARTKLGQRFFRTAFFLPHVVSLAVVGVIFSMVYDPFFGLLNGAFRAAGLDFMTRSWLGDPDLVLFSVAAASAWQGYGLYMLLFLAGLQNIDHSLYDVAAVDGANSLQQFRHVTLPGLREVSTLVLSLAMINGFKGFATVWVMTQGGPFYASELLNTYIFKLAFQFQQQGKSAALCMVLGLLAITLTIAFNRWRERGKRW